MTHMTPEVEALAKGAATLATCIVHSLNRRDPGYGKTFLKSLDEAQRILRDDGKSSDELTIAMLIHTRSLLTGASLSSDRKGPLLPDWPPATDDRYDPHRPESYFK